MPVLHHQALLSPGAAVQLLRLLPNNYVSSTVAALAAHQI